MEVDLEPHARADAVGATPSADVPLCERFAEAVAFLAAQPQFGCAGGSQGAVSVGACEQDRVGSACVVSGRAPAGDGEGLAAAVLVLEPGAGAAAWCVGSVEALGDDALELVGAGDSEHVVELAGELGRHSPARTGCSQ